MNPFKWLWRLAGGFLSFPGVSMLGGPVSAVLGAISALLRTVIDGLTKIVSNPVTLAAMFALGGGLFCYGVFFGVELDGNRAVRAIKACNLQIATIELNHNTAVLREVEKAQDAANQLPDLPADLTEACKRSASCRSRGKL